MPRVRKNPPKHKWTYIPETDTYRSNYSTAELNKYHIKAPRSRKKSIFDW